jgi:hypothetical protein
VNPSNAAGFGFVPASASGTRSLRGWVAPSGARIATEKSRLGSRFHGNHKTLQYH